MHWLISWMLYLLGDLACKIMYLHSGDDDRFAQYWVGFWYPVYNNLMCWSSDVQGKTGNGPWGAVSNEVDSSPEQQS